MTLSILRISHNYPNTHMLYDSDGEKAILMGPEDALFQTKTLIEMVEQEKSNQEHRDLLRERYLHLITAGGQTLQEATEFLKIKMPYLFQ